MSSRYSEKNVVILLQSSDVILIRKVFEINKALRDVFKYFWLQVTVYIMKKKTTTNAQLHSGIVPREILCRYVCIVLHRLQTT